MTAKKYLNQAFRLNDKINANQMELDRLQELAVSIPSFDLSKDRVQSGSVSDHIGYTVDKIVALQQVINAEIDRLIDLKAEIRQRLNRISNDDFRLIIQKRYLNFQKWEQIAVDLGVTSQWAHVLHKRALKDFETYMPVDCN